MLAALCVGNVATLPARNRRARIRSRRHTATSASRPARQRARFQDRVLSPFVTWLARAMLRLNAKQSLESLSHAPDVRRDAQHVGADIPGREGHLRGGGILLGIVIGAFSSVTAVFIFASMLGAHRLYRAGDRRLAACEAPAVDHRRAASRCTRSARGERRGRPRLRRRSFEADAVHVGPAAGRVRAGARRDADRREPVGRTEEAGPAGAERPRCRRSSGRSCRRISSAHLSDASCASRRQTLVSSGKPLRKSAR